MMPPQNRGATTRASGSTAIISIAESCSVAFIRPISAVIALPARLANKQAGHHRAELAHERQRDQHAERFGGAVALQHVVALQRQHHSDEQAGDEDDDEREHAGKVDLAQREVSRENAAGDLQDDRDEEARGIAQPAMMLIVLLAQPTQRMHERQRRQRQHGRGFLGEYGAAG